MKVQATGAKSTKIHTPPNVKLWSAITLVLWKIQTHTVVKFACSMRFSATADRIVWPISLSGDRKW